MCFISLINLIVAPNCSEKRMLLKVAYSTKSCTKLTTVAQKMTSKIYKIIFSLACLFAANSFVAQLVEQQ